LPRDRARNHRPRTLVILHSLATGVEQLCARSAGAPSVEDLRPPFCTQCGQLARDLNGAVCVQGHGFYNRQVCGLNEGWIVIWVRRYCCQRCGHTMSRLPDWLHPWRWYAAAAIVESLFRHLILGETAHAIGIRFGRSEHTSQWRSLLRWRAKLLVSPTLWGWLGPRLGVGFGAVNREQGRRHLTRFLGEMNVEMTLAASEVPEFGVAVRATLGGRIHNRLGAWLLGRFRPGMVPAPDSGSMPIALPTEKDSGPGPPS
jgi:hypothetical protein